MYRKIAFFLSVLILASCGSKQENSETEATSIIPVNVVGCSATIVDSPVLYSFPASDSRAAISIE
jgi:HlyD family secretion protein